nr:transporter substrate-binding domain-containing protein [Leifsonia sp. C5G2]
MGGEEEILPAVSTSSLAFQAVLDDLIRTTDLPDLAAPSPPSGDILSPLGARGDKMSPLAAARDADGPPGAGASVPPSGDISSQLASSGDILSPLAGRAGPPPARLRGRGDLTLVVGLGGDAEAAAAVLAASADAGAEVVRVADRRDALAARADGVRRDLPLVAAYALAGPGAVPAVVAELAGIAPDQVWVAVDVSRRPEDTAEWVRAVDAVLAIDAVAATGAAFTSSPDDIHRLGLPVLWLDAPPAG